MSIKVLLIGLLFSQVTFANYIQYNKDNSSLDHSIDQLIKIQKNKKAGFNFPYYLFIPKTMNNSVKNYLYVEPTNTGARDDNFGYHDTKTKRDIQSSYPQTIAQGLKTAVLMPVFPRLASLPLTYTHALDRDTMLIKDGELERIDLQLIAMIKHAQSILIANKRLIEKKVFMHGFSASSKFTNRFTILHPEWIKAAATGGVNGMATIPSERLSGVDIRYPVGISDIKTLTGQEFNQDEYLKVAQFIYMGRLDRNDTLPYREAFASEDAELISELIGSTMMPNRWERTQEIYHKYKVPAQFVTYESTHHQVKSEMIADLINFFNSNKEDNITFIDYHHYPYVPYREIRNAQITGLYLKNDPLLPKEINYKLDNNNQMVIIISNNFREQDYRQFNDLIENAGFSFILQIDGEEDIIITPANHKGNMSGSLKYGAAFIVNLPSKLIKNKEYYLTPIITNMNYRWSIDPDVKLIVRSGTPVDPVDPQG